MKIEHSSLIILSSFLVACSASIPAPTPTSVVTPVPPPTATAPRPTSAPVVIPAVSSNVSPIAPPAVASALASPLLPTVAANLPTPPQFSGKTLTVVTHDSFSLNPKLIAGFERQTGAKVNILKSGDAGAMLNKVILSKGSPLGDVVFGIDNTFFSRAIDANIFEAYAPKGVEGISTELRLDKDNRLIPIDFGYVNINYDLQYFKTKGLALPQSLRDLTKPEYKGKLVVQNPATSSPGLAFVIATIATFGESGNYTWKDFWRDLRKNEVIVTSGWDQAYYERFSASSGKGDAPMVVSYSTSPAAEVFYSEGAIKEPPTGNILPAKGVFRQIEFAGVVKGAKEPALAKVWMDYLLTSVVQEDLAPSMAVYPAVNAAKLDEVFAKYAPNVKEPADVAPDVIAKNREKWIQEWTQVVLR